MPSNKANRSSLPWEPFKEGRKPTRRYHHISLFSGAGGTDIGLEYAGFKTVFSNDIEEDAVETYLHNNPEARTHATCGDITKLKLPKIKDDIDLLTAGFPCQPFSKSGKQMGMEETRGTLFWNIAKIIETHKPSIVLLENVRNITGPRHMHEWEVIIQTLRDLGYRVSEDPHVVSPHLIKPEFCRIILTAHLNHKP